MIKQIALILPLLVLSGCLTSNVPPPNYYVLHAGIVEFEDRKKLPKSITVERPSLVSGLNTNRIALLKNNRRELDYFAEARWNGELDDVLHDFVIETFENTYNALTVHKAGMGQNADYIIVTKIRDFQAEYQNDTNTAPVLRVGLVVSVLKAGSLKTVVQVEQSLQKQASDNSISAITNGLEGLLQQALEGILLEVQKKI